MGNHKTATDSNRGATFNNSIEATEKIPEQNQPSKMNSWPSVRGWISARTQRPMNLVSIDRVVAKKNISNIGWFTSAVALVHANSGIA